jgi:hypothetical protein
MTEPSISISRDIDAPAARIFAVVSDPAMHPELDGTGMLRSAVDNEVITQVGDVFHISMVHWHLGNYVMAKHVIVFEQDRRIGWEPIVHSYENPDYVQAVGRPGLREWGWKLEPLGESRTRVTEYFEGSRLPQELRTFIEDGEFWRPAMEVSMDNLEQLVTDSNTTGGEPPRSKTASEFVELFQSTRT